MQPFEVIKIRLANQSLATPEYHGIVDCFKKIKIKEGLHAFYRGTFSPLIGVGPQVALQFASNEFIKKFLTNFYGNQNSSKSPSIELAFLSGCLSGIPSALVATPVDLARIQMQKGGGDK
jgi:solute carrier family 25 carnitine/acylcarnitine transporter 20/29